MSQERTRPVALWVAGIFGILLGLLGSCGGAMGLGTTLAQDTLVDAQREFTETSGMTPGQIEQQRRMQDRTVEINHEWRGPMLGTHVLNLLSSIGLMLACVLMFRWSPWTAKVMAAACIASVITDFALGGLGIYIQQQTLAAMSESMPATGDAEVDRLAEGFVQAGATSGICFTLGWVLAKLGVYAGSLWAVSDRGHGALFRPKGAA